MCSIAYRPRLFIPLNYPITYQGHSPNEYEYTYSNRTLTGAGDRNINIAGTPIFKLLCSGVSNRCRSIGANPSFPTVNLSVLIRIDNFWLTSISLNRSTHMSIGTLLLIILILMLLGVIPAWPHSRSWGYGPSGGLGLIVIILLVLVLLGRI